MRVKMSKHPPPAPTASAVGPCPTVIQIVGRPGTGSSPSTIAPPDHPIHQYVMNKCQSGFGIWLVGCFGFNGPLRHYFSLYRAVSQREGERGKKGKMRVKMSKQPPPAPTASAVGPCPTIIQIIGRPGTGSLPSTIAPLDHPRVWEKQTENKLHELKPDFNSKCSFLGYSRQIQPKITRCRIGHTRLTHAYLLINEQPPFCISCNEPFTVKNFLITCTEFNYIRKKYYTNTQEL